MRVLLFAAALFAAPAFAQTTPAQTPGAKPSPEAMTVARGSRVISELEIANSPQDYRLVGQVRSSAFNNGDKERAFSLPVANGKTYKLVAACDENCDGLDMKAQKPEGPVDADITDNPVALIDIAPGPATTVAATVILGKCSRDPCVAALALFEKKSK